MATARLVASAYSTSATSVSVSSASNMYTDTDSTNYADCTHSNNNTTAYYVYLKGFNIGSIPSNAVVSAFEVKIKGYESRLSTSSSYAPALCNNTSVISGTTASTSFGSSTTTITIPTGSLKWADIVSYGANFGIRIAIRRSNKNQQGHAYIYGAEIDVTYSIPASDELYYKANGAWVRASKAYKKINGVWVEQTDLTNVFDAQTNYVKGN